MTAALHVRRTSSREPLVAELAARIGTRPGLAALLGDLDRRAHRSVVPRLLGRRVATAWGWDAEDRRNEWWPQGVSTTVDATGLGTVPDGIAGRRVAVVSSYAKPVPGPGGTVKQGARLTFLDLGTGAYRHVLLVKPVRRDDGTVGHEPVPVHAGGVVWSGSWLHVAATGKGCVSAHLDDLVHLGDGERDTAFGYRWVLPTRVDHRGGADEGTEKLRWSFLSLDVGTRSLVVGEYGRGEKSTRIARFPLADDGLPAGSPEDAALTRATEVVDTGVKGMQGVASVDGRLHVTTSHGGWLPGSLVTARSHDARGWRRTVAAAPMGPEDLSWSPAERLLWTPTEHPRRRWLVALRPPR